MRLNADRLHTHLKRNTLAPVYLVSGDEPLQLTESIDNIRSLARDNGYMERVVFEADKSFDWNRLLQEQASLSLFAGKKILELRLGTGKPGRDGGPALIEYTQQLTDDNVLIISCSRLDRKTLATRWCKALDKAGVVVQVWPVDAKQLPGWIRQRFIQRGKRIDRSGAEFIAQRVEGNLMAASQEIEKLCLLISAEDITIKDVSSAVVDSARFDVFAMMETAFLGDMSRTARMLNGFRNEGVEPMAIYGAMLWNVRQLVTMASSVATGMSMEQMFSSQWGMSGQRKTALKKVLQRHSERFLQGLLVNAGKIDRVVKGGNQPLSWACFHELLAGLASHKPADMKLINALTSTT
ncbi:MAG: DNA polymerase III subunit delta [Thiotrichales bacterium]|nr:DNA polymerase III subunit delta [Thiotrichales bacterium]